MLERTLSDDGLTAAANEALSTDTAVGVHPVFTCAAKVARVTHTLVHLLLTVTARETWPEITATGEILFTCAHARTHSRFWPSFHSDSARQE